MIEIPTTDLALDDVRLGDIEQWMRPDREGIFAKLRAERPISFQEEPAPPPEMGIPQGPGFWALTRHDDVVHVRATPTCSIRRRHRPSATYRRKSRNGSAA